MPEAVRIPRDTAHRYPDDPTTHLELGSCLLAFVAREDAAELRIVVCIDRAELRLEAGAVDQAAALSEYAGRLAATAGLECLGSVARSQLARIRATQGRLEEAERILTAIAETLARHGDVGPS